MPGDHVGLGAPATLLCARSLLLACSSERPPEEGSRTFERQIALEDSAGDVRQRPHRGRECRRTPGRRRRQQRWHAAERALVVSALLCTIVAPAFAQDALEPVIVIDGVPFNAPPVDQEATTVASVRFVNDMAKDYITRSAEKVTDEHYAFQPTEEVRTFVGILGHIADANYMWLLANPNG